MTLILKKAALIIAVSTGLIACNSAQITGGPLEIGAAQSNNLLDHGGFERGFGDWRACSDPQLVSLQTNDTRTEGSAILEARGCLYQTVPAQANDNMIVNCNATKSNRDDWTSLTFGYLDANYKPLDTVEEQIMGTAATNVTASLRAPADTAYAEVLIYTESGAVIEDCELINTQRGVSSELLINSHFEEELTAWQACSQGTVTADNAIATVTNSCISQKFTASEGLELQLTCDSYKTGTEHAAVVLGYLDDSFQGIELTEAPISTVEGLFPSVTLTAPADTVYVEAMVYGLGQVDINSCSLNSPLN